MVNLKNMSEIPRGEQSEQEPKVEITEYLDKYKDAVMELIFKIAENELGHRSKSGRPDLQKIKEIYQKDRGNFWVALRAGEIVGTIGLKDMGENRGDLWRFYVKKELREKGIGQKLFFALMDFAENNGYKEIFLSTRKDQEAANEFYLKHGFEQMESLPEDFPHSENDDTFYRLDLGKEK